MPLPPKLGFPVTTRQFSLLEMVSRAWGSEFQAPDHGVYIWSNGRRFDSTDQGFTGIYSRNIPIAIPQATAPVLSGALVGPDVVLNWTAASITGSTIGAYQVLRNIDGGAFSLLTTVGNVLTYTDLAPATGHTYGYEVIAIPVVGVNSNPSNTVFESPALAGFVINVGDGVPQGFSFEVHGWDGLNGQIGPGSTGALVSGTAPFLGPGSQFCVGDAVGGFPPGLSPPLFTVNLSSVASQSAFTSVTVNGHTYLTASVDFFSNGGGCGPTIWEWAVPSGMILGNDYAIVFVV